VGHKAVGHGTSPESGGHEAGGIWRQSMAFPLSE